MGRLIATLLTLACLTGCGAKVQLEKTDEIESQQTRFYASTAPSPNHKLRIELTSDQPLTLMVFMSREVNEADPETMMNAKTALAKSEKKPTATLEVTIPTAEGFTVAISNTGKKARYTLKMNSQ